MLKLFIETGNAAFSDDSGDELARILETLAARIRNNGPESYVVLRDINGNKVGEAQFAESGE